MADRLGKLVEELDHLSTEELAEYLAYYHIKGKEEKKQAEQARKEVELQNKQKRPQQAPMIRGRKPKKRK